MGGIEYNESDNRHNNEVSMDIYLSKDQPNEVYTNNNINIQLEPNRDLQNHQNGNNIENELKLKEEEKKNNNNARNTVIVCVIVFVLIIVVFLIVLGVLLRRRNNN